MKALSIIIVYLSVLQQTWGNPLQQQTTPGIFRDTLTPLSSSENNPVRLIDQVLPQYQIFTHSQQLPTVLSSQGINGWIRGQNQQLLQVPISGFTYSNPATHHFGTAGFSSGASQFGNLMHPIMQQSLKHGGIGETILLPGNQKLVESTKYGNVVPNVLVRQPVAGTINSGAVTGQHSTFVDGDGLLQFSTKPDSSTLSTLSSGSSNAGGQVVTSFPNLIQNSQNIGNSIYPGVVPNFGNLGTIYSPNVRPLGFNILQTSGSTVQDGTMVPPNNVGAIIPNPGLQTQTIQVPCTLQIPSPVPISVNPGVSQIIANIPMGNPGSVIPSSFIDNSPPTIAILRPPPPLQTLIDSDYAAPTSLVSTLIREPNQSLIFTDVKSQSPFATTSLVQQTKENARSQDSPGALVQNDEDEPSESALNVPSEYASDLARNGIPMVYAMLPSSLSSPSYIPGVSPAVVPLRTSTGSSKKKDTKSSTSQPNRGNNPFFNVNKRKHFEFYQYF